MSIERHKRIEFIGKSNIYMHIVKNYVFIKVLIYIEDSYIEIFIIILPLPQMDQEYNQPENSIQTEDIEKFSQYYATSLSLNDGLDIAPEQPQPTAPLIYNSTQNNVIDQNFAFQVHQYNAIKFTLDYWDSIVNGLQSSDAGQQLYGMIGMRKLLSVEENPPIQKVIDAQLVPLIISYAAQNQYPQIKFEALWALTNVASGTTQQTQTVVERGGIQIFVNCLNSPILAIVEQAIWVIGNLAGDNHINRDMLIHLGTIDNLCNLIAQNSHHASLTKNGAWALCNLCRGRPLPVYAQIQKGVRFCCQYIVQNHITDLTILTEMLLVLAYLEQLKDDLDPIYANQFIAKLSSYLALPSTNIIILSLRILSNLFENEALADYFIKNKCMDLMIPLLGHQKKTIRKQTCFLISRLTDIHNYDFDQIFFNPAIIQALLQLFDQADVQVKIQLAYVFSNLSCHDNLHKVYLFYRQTDILKYYASLLTGIEQNLMITLQCIDKILYVGDKHIENQVNMLADSLKKSGAITLLENLQTHPSTKVYQSVYEILDKYFYVEDIQQDQNQNGIIFEQFGAAPNAPNQSYFQF